MIDIHCHILPGIDDGAKNLTEAKRMLKLQLDSGVNCMYLTPHFDPEEKTLERFLTEREEAWSWLSSDYSCLNGLQMRLGAEVSCCGALLSLDLSKLTLGTTNYLLLEFPQRYPAYAESVIQLLLDKGVIPILAHVERYSYFREEPGLLMRLINLGVLAQVSAQALFDKRDRNFAVACLRHNLAQIVASDAHNISTRKPCMDLLYKLPEELLKLHNSFSAAVWENKSPEKIQATRISKTFFGYC